MPQDFDLEGFEKDLDETLKRGRAAFKGKYKVQLNQLAGLSREEIDAITPGMTDLMKYDELMTVVKEASRVNLSQAALKRNITSLGAVAVKIAKRVPSFAKLLA